MPRKGNQNVIFVRKTLFLAQALFNQSRGWAGFVSLNHFLLRSYRYDLLWQRFGGRCLTLPVSCFKCSTVEVLVFPGPWRYPAALFCGKFLSPPSAFKSYPCPRMQRVGRALRWCSEQFLDRTGSARRGVEQHTQHVLNFRPPSPTESRSQAVNSSLDAAFIQKHPCNVIAEDSGSRCEGFCLLYKEYMVASVLIVPFHGRCGQFRWCGFFNARFPFFSLHATCKEAALRYAPDVGGRLFRMWCLLKLWRSL